MKGIAGTGSLAIPSAMLSVLFSLTYYFQTGIVWGVVLFFVIAGIYILAAYQLISIHNQLNNKKVLFSFFLLVDPG